MLSDGSNSTTVLNSNFYYGYLAKMVELAVNKVTVVTDSKYFRPNNQFPVSAYSTIIVMDPQTGNVYHHCPRTTQIAPRYRMPSLGYLKLTSKYGICDKRPKRSKLKVLLRLASRHITLFTYNCTDIVF